MFIGEPAVQTPIKMEESTSPKIQYDSVPIKIEKPDALTSAKTASTKAKNGRIWTPVAFWHLFDIILNIWHIKTLQCNITTVKRYEKLV